MSYFEAIILGVIQGLAEFLPISSSAHLVLVPYVFHWEYGGTQFDIALHLGTLIALLAYFWRDYIALIKAGLRGVKSSEGKLAWYIIAATIPAGLIGYQFEDRIDTTFRSSPIAIALVLALLGVVLVVVDVSAKKIKTERQLSWWQALSIGVAQSMALFPGVSRSGATITAGLLAGLNREAAAKFSFLLSGPVVVAAALFKLRNITITDISGPFIVGVMVSGFVGYLSIKYLLRYLKHGSYSVFAWYRIALAVIVITVAMIRG